MGWFWAEGAVPATRTMPPHHPDPNSARSPPPECPMHQKSATAITPAPKVPESACPYTPPDASPSAIEPTPASTSTRSKYNPLNYMFSDLSQKPSPNQRIILDTEREPSTIPRGRDSDSTSSPGNWEYPSPQQMYNALLRKGYHDTDPTAVTSMVSVHNFLNEGAWAEIALHEGLFAGGLRDGWQKCKNGEENLDIERVKAEADPKLMRFQGRPKDMTPKAAMWQVLGWIYPSKFETAPPFDRHDWFVERVTPSTSTSTAPSVRQIRYVIDYYAAPDDEDGNPVFALDVRPAIDSPGVAAERVIRWSSDVWWRAKGGEVAWTRPWIEEKKLEEFQEKKGWF